MAKRILVVEDAPDNRSLIREVLEIAGYRVIEAVNGQEGVEMAFREHPDLILMDLSLPIMSGWEATSIIKADPELATIPVVALTAHALAGDEEKALAAGCDGYIAKPIDVMHFVAQVRRFL